VPYYRSLFHDKAFDPASIKSLSDLARLPFLTKEIIRANTEQLKSEVAQAFPASTQAAPVANHSFSFLVMNVSATMWQPNGALPAGGVWTSVIRKLLCGVHL